VTFLPKKIICRYHFRQPSYVFAVTSLTPSSIRHRHPSLSVGERHHYDVICHVFPATSSVVAACFIPRFTKNVPHGLYRIRRRSRQSYLLLTCLMIIEHVAPLQPIRGCCKNIIIICRAATTFFELQASCF